MGWLSDDNLTEKMVAEDNNYKNWYFEPKNQVEVLMPDGSYSTAYLCPGFISTTYKSDFRRDIGFYRVDYKVCSRACMSGDGEEFSICALLSDGVWRICKSKDLVEYALSTGVYEQ